MTTLNEFFVIEIGSVLSLFMDLEKDRLHYCHLSFNF